MHEWIHTNMTYYWSSFTSDWQLSVTDYTVETLRRKSGEMYLTKYCIVINTVIPSVLWRCWLGSRKGIRPVKNFWVVGYWRGYLSGARCRLAYGPADATASHSLASVKSRLVLPFWYRLTRVVPDKGPLNGSLSLSLNFQRFSLKPWRASGYSRKANAIWCNYILLKTD